MWWSSFLAVTCAAATTAAVSVPRSHVIHEARPWVPSRWVKKDRVSHDAVLPVRVGLAQSNLDKAHDHLMDVSDPTSPNYGKHWTSEQVIKAFQPSSETVQTVHQWLVDAGIPAHTITHSDNKAWLAFTASSKQMESLLHTEYHEYEDEKTGGITPACDSYYVPEHIHPHVDYITPGVKLLAPNDVPVENGGRPKQTKRDTSSSEVGPHHGPSGNPWPLSWKPAPPYYPNGGNDDLKHCDVTVTPACIAALYHIPRSGGKPPNPKNSLGIYEAELQFWDQLDLDLFFTNFTRWIPNGTHPMNRDIDGGVAKSKPALAGGESMLDLSNAYPIVYPQEITIFNDDDLKYQTWPSELPISREQ